MTVIAVGSVHGGPGSTALALDLAQCCGGDALLVEADPDGGCLAARLNLAVRPGLTELAGAARSRIAPADVWNFAQPTDFGVAVIVAHPAAELVHGALRASAGQIGGALRSINEHVIIDVGRVRPGSPSLGLAALADRVIVLSSNCVESVVSLTHRATLLRTLPDATVVLTASRPYGASDIEVAAGCRVWGAVPNPHRRRGRRERRRALERLVAESLSPAPPQRQPAGPAPALAVRS
jgi:MinD-like ATPase involved in chromosome partitioning or flagellar assembly